MLCECAGFGIKRLMERMRVAGIRRIEKRICKDYCRRAG